MNTSLDTEHLCRMTMPDQKKRVRDFFETSEIWQGTVYDDQSERFNRAMLRRKLYAMEMIGAIPPEHRGRALDVGCGCGAYAEELLKLGFDTFATDLSQGMLDSCRERLHLGEHYFRDHFRRGDIEALPFSDQSFDLVVSIGVFGYLLTDEQALNEVRRVLRPGGYFLVSVQNMSSLSNIDYVVRRKIKNVIGGRSDGGPNPGKDDVAMEVPWVGKHSSTHLRYKSYFPRRFERMMLHNGFWLDDAMTLGHEFRIVRRYNLLPERLLTRVEVLLERFFWWSRIPLFRYSGETYTALFQLDEEAAARLLNSDSRPDL